MKTLEPGIHRTNLKIVVVIDLRVDLWLLLLFSFIAIEFYSVFLFYEFLSGGEKSSSCALKRFSKITILTITFHSWLLYYSLPITEFWSRKVWKREEFKQLDSDYMNAYNF